MTGTSRLHYLDNLRALAMLTGVVFHAALAYSTVMHPYWPTADPSHSLWVDAGVWFLHLFRMPLFFAIAGFFAAMLAERRGVGGLLRNRASRVLLPLLIFWPIITLATGAMIPWAIGHVEHTPPLLTLLQQGDLPSRPPGLAHLWFLAYLLLFYLIVWIATAADWTVSHAWVLTNTPARLLGVAPLLLVPALANVSAPTPAPEELLPQPWAIVYYGGFFLFGYALHHRPAILEQMRLGPWALGLASLIAYVTFLALLDRQTNRGVHLVIAVLEAYISVWMTVWCLQVGRRWLNRETPWLRYVSDSSYWTYLVHLPVVFALQFLLIDWTAGWVTKLTVSTIATLGICLTTYQLAVRGRAIGRLLNGTRDAGTPASSSRQEV